MSEWNATRAPGERRPVLVLHGGRKRRRRRVSWADAAVWGGTIVLCVVAWALVVVVGVDIAHAL